jgi:hypothetical protein
MFRDKYNIHTNKMTGIGYVHGGVVNETRYSSAHGGGRRNCLLAWQARLILWPVIF